MEIRKRVLGEEYLDTLTSMTNLAFTWKEQGRNIEAAKLIEDYTYLRTRVLGADYPYLLLLLSTLNAWRLENL
jgi:hypothetical protein